MMPKYNLVARHKELTADALTPVGLYLSLRNLAPIAILMESTAFPEAQDRLTYIAFDPIAGFQLKDGHISTYFPGKQHRTPLFSLVDQLQDFVSAFEGTDTTKGGLFGYTCFEAVQYFEQMRLSSPPVEDMPLVRYDLYRYVIVFDHRRQVLTLSEYEVPGKPSQFEKIERTIKQSRILCAAYPFRALGEEVSCVSDKIFLDNIYQAQRHCFRGDLFQIVLSRRFSRAFEGDDFQVYRALRTINPSPYHFYFGYEEFAVFGASPEPHLKVQHQRASVFPIAGTYLRTGDLEEDKILAAKLRQDRKENAEHYMLIDLVRDDLNKHCDDVEVVSVREIQHFSHVMHMVSEVQARLGQGVSPYQVLADCFPAGTLSGAPKRRAIDIISKMEPHARGLYGGAIGWMDPNGALNHAIIIRSFVSRHQELSYQGGAGIVAQSDPKTELQEVHNKLRALREALKQAETLETL